MLKEKSISIRTTEDTIQKMKSLRLEYNMTQSELLRMLIDTEYEKLQSLKNYLEMKKKAEV